MRIDDGRSRDCSDDEVVHVLGNAPNTSDACPNSQTALTDVRKNNQRPLWAHALLGVAVLAVSSAGATFATMPGEPTLGPSGTLCTKCVFPPVFILL